MHVFEQEFCIIIHHAIKAFLVIDLKNSETKLKCHNNDVGLICF